MSLAHVACCLVESVLTAFAGYSKGYTRDSPRLRGTGTADPGGWQDPEKAERFADAGMLLCLA